MSSQYDDIGSKYGVFKELWTSSMEEENIKKAVQPYLSAQTRPRVLDLASGTGFYSARLIDWGADYVVGVDLSGGMINAAQALLSKEGKYAGKVQFRVGNALNLGKLEDEGPFDIVLGAWLLNYASNLDEMTRMFHSIATNLKEGGVFVGLTPSPVEDLDKLVERWPEIQSKFPSDYPLEVDYYERLSSGDGWKAEIRNKIGENMISFRNFHLRQSVYEAGARRAGMKGEIDWPKVEAPEELKDKAVSVSEAWKTAGEEGTSMGIMVARK